MGNKAVNKITAKIWRQTIEKLEHKLDAACLRRDSYLSRVLDVELPRLDREICLRNSPDANRFVANRLESLGERKLVTFSLDPEVAERLNEICGRKLIVRDAFLNRMLLLLAASPKLINSLFFKGLGMDLHTFILDRQRTEDPAETRPSIVWGDRDSHSAIYPLEPNIDPFWAIRLGIEESKASEAIEFVDFTDPVSGSVVKVQEAVCDGNFTLPDGIYSSIFHDKQFKELDLYGLNCYVPDWLVPGHEAERRTQKQLDELFGD